MIRFQKKRSEGKKKKETKREKKRFFIVTFLIHTKREKQNKKTNHSLDVKQKIARIFLGGAGGASSTVRAAAALRFLSRVSQTTTSSRSLNSIAEGEAHGVALEVVAQRDGEDAFQNASALSALEPVLAKQAAKVLCVLQNDLQYTQKKESKKKVSQQGDQKHKKTSQEERGEGRKKTHLVC